MSMFDTLYAESAAPLLLENNGDSVTVYPSPRAARGVELTGIMGFEGVQQQDEEQTAGRRRKRVRSVTFSNDPDSPFGGVAEPSEQMIVEYDGVQYVVDREAADAVKITGSFCTLQLIRSGLAARTSPGYER